LLELETEFLESTSKDPITLQNRAVSSIDLLNIFVQFRQDLTDHRLAWGITYRAPTKGPFFFANEVSLNRDGRN